MNDNLLFFIINSNISLASFLAVAIKFYLQPERISYFRGICSGQVWSLNELSLIQNQVVLVVGTVSFLGHVLLSIPIAIRKYWNNTETLVVPFNHQASTNTDLGNTLITTITFILVASILICFRVIVRRYVWL